MGLILVLFIRYYFVLFSTFVCVTHVVVVTREMLPHFVMHAAACEIWDSPGTRSAFCSQRSDHVLTRNELHQMEETLSSSFSTKLNKACGENASISVLVSTVTLCLYSVVCWSSST